MHICTHKSCKLAYALLPGLANRVSVCYISSIVVYLHWVFNNRHYFYDKETFIGLFKSSASARLYLEVLVTILRLNLKTVRIDSFLLCYYCWVLVELLSASARLYLEVLVTILRLNLKTVRIDSFLLFYVIFPFVSSIALFSSRKKWLSYLLHGITNRVILITCICQLHFMLFHK